MDFTEIITLVLSGTTVGGAVSALFYRRQNKALKNNEVAVSTVEAKRSQMDLVEDYEKKVLELCNSTYEQTKANMRAVLKDIQDGTFADRWISENMTGRCFFNSMRERLAQHPMEIVGKQLREQMLWKNDADLDNASN